MKRMANSTGPDDFALCARAAAGDEEAFAELFRRRQGQVYRFAMKMGATPAVAEEVTQEVFLALLNQLDRVNREAGALSTLLYAIARNQLLRHLSRNGREIPGKETMPEPAAAEPGPFEQFAARQRTEQLRVAVLSLPAHYREVIVLCDLEELSQEDAARVLGCPAGTVKSRLFRARQQLWDRLQERESAAGNSRGGVTVRCLA